LRLQLGDERLVVAVEAVGHHRPEADPGRPRLRHEFGSKLRLGGKRRVALACSVSASAVRVLLRSRGASSPAR
jgi:hypothetical protein